ncbi:MAG: MtnX-like HAD-IB family phosphatase [Casimicrobiaceae bacterium]
MRTRADAEPVASRPALFFDFDNTITLGDVLDHVIERFSTTDDWRRWEDAWSRGEISTQQCLERQIAGLDASQAQLVEFVADFPIDPNFETIVRWAASEQIELIVVSDNFSCLVREILSNAAFAELPLFTNELTFSGNRPMAHFPYASRDCARCANCKVTHFKRFSGRRTIYVGDGLSDVCPALAADLVFAKDSLADYLGARGVAFQPFVSLGTVADFLIGGQATAAASRHKSRRMHSGVAAPALAEGLSGDS